MNNFDKDVDNISLCFSGGGLRATFFHLGTFLALKDAGYTKNINEIYSVSGGSIAAAHIVLNWDKYNDTNQTELEATKELIGAGSLDIRGRVFRRELILLMSLPFFNQFLSFFGFPIIWPRTKIAIDQYKNLFERKKLNDLSSDGTPKLYLLATSLTKGKVAAFGREGLSIGSEKYEGEEIQIALAVAASSAFPPLFPPITLPAKMFGARRDRFPVDEELLSDGGVYDNLGCYIPMNRGSSDWIVLSDASASIDNIYNKSFNSLVSRAVRSTNIVMERLSEETLKALHERGKFAHVRIGNLRFAQSSPPESSIYLAPETHAATAAIRTDLDIFSASEIKALAINGYIQCANVLGMQVDQNKIARLNFITNEKVERADLDISSERRLFYGNWRDWTSYVITVIFATQITSVIFVAIMILDSYFRFMPWWR